MTSNIELQQAYIKLYTFLRQYIWDFSVVEIIADLEVATFTRFPDKGKLQSLIRKLETEIRDLLKGDDNEDFNKAWQRFKDIAADDEYYHKLYQVAEVIPV